MITRSSKALILSCLMVLSACGENSKTPSEEVVSSEIVARGDKLWTPGMTLRVRFLDGNKKQQQFVIDAVKDWSKYANIDFEFIDGAKRLFSRKSDEAADIRVSFAGNGGNNSYVGTDALRFFDQQERFTMSLTSLTVKNAVDERSARSIVLHEFGHALGLLHEHMSPLRDIEYDLEKIYENCETLLSFDKEKCDLNIVNTLDTENLIVSDFDKYSIMGYSLHSQFYRNKDKKTDPIKTLSIQDKIQISRLYPGRMSEQRIIIEHIKEMEEMKVYNSCKILTHEEPDAQNQIKTYCAEGEYAVGTYVSNRKGYALFANSCNKNFNDALVMMNNTSNCRLNKPLF
jgi:serralysin